MGAQIKATNILWIGKRRTNFRQHFLFQIKKLAGTTTLLFLDDALARPAIKVLIGFILFWLLLLRDGAIPLAQQAF